MDIIRELDQQFTCNDIIITDTMSNWKYSDAKDYYYRDIAAVIGSEGIGKYKIQIADKIIEFNVTN